MYRTLLHVFNFLMLAVFVAAFVIDHNAEWKPYQKKYYAMAADAMEAAGDAEGAKDMRRRPLQIKQIQVGPLGRIDRCITCHVGMDEYTNPTLKNEFTEHPYKGHPDVEGLWKNHKFTKFGCTACHRGQGLATTTEDAHGFVHNWEQPILKGVLIQGTCVKCHGDYKTLKGAEVAAKGRRLMEKHGCFGCHSIDGFGGAVSEPLDHIASKPFQRISLYHFPLIKIRGKDVDRHHWNVQTWVRGHIMNDPMVIVPNDPHAHYNADPIAPSGMPDFTGELSYDDADAIAAYLMSRSEDVIPSDWYRYAEEKPDPRSRSTDPLVHGKYVFEKYGCAGCHGLGGTKGRRNFNAMGPGQKDHEKDMDKGVIPTLTEVMGSYTEEELKIKILAGVPASAITLFNAEGPGTPLYMPSWKDKIKGKELDHLAKWLLSIAKKESEEDEW